MTTHPSYAPGTAHILSSHNRPSLETDLVLSDFLTWAWTYISWVWVHWVLKVEVLRLIQATDGIKDALYRVCVPMRHCTSCNVKVNLLCKNILRLLRLAHYKMNVCSVMWRKWEDLRNKVGLQSHLWRVYQPCKLHIYTVTWMDHS